MNLLKDGLIDMAILYEPIHHPSIKIDKLMDEKLVLVSTEPRSIESGQVEGYVFVDWGYGFTTQHNLAFPDAHNPKISFAIADTALNHVLKNGGSGYFSEASIQPLLKTKQCFLVKDAPIFNRPLYLGYSKNGMNSKLFNDSIKEDEVWNAIKKVGAEKFINKLPNGLQFDVKERGISLSVGQRQLISCIRIMLYDPKIILLDEATSSIDSESETMIQKAISEILKNRTSIVVAHRLSTIKEVDKIVVIDSGEIKEIGNHKDLIQSNGFYKKLYEMQYKNIAN